MQPRSLVLRKQECFYCFKKEGTRCCEISHCFGIISCDNHYKASVRDCNAYMHREQIVPVDYALNHKDLASFFDLLKDGFPVQRSSGVIEYDWVVNGGPFYNPEYISYDKEIKDWILPVKTKDGSLSKRMGMLDLSRPFVCEKMQVDFLDTLKKAIRILNDGIYKEDSDTHDIIGDSETPKLLEETVGVKWMLAANSIVRVLMNP